MSSPLFTSTIIKKGALVGKRGATKHMSGKKKATPAVDAFSDSSEDEKVALSRNASNDQKSDSREDEDEELYESSVESVASMAYYEEAMNQIMDDSDSGSDLDLSAYTNATSTTASQGNQSTKPLSNLFASPSANMQKDPPNPNSLKQRHAHKQSPSLFQRKMLTDLAEGNRRGISPIVRTGGFEASRAMSYSAINTNSSNVAVHDSDSSSDDGVFLPVQQQIDTEDILNARAKQIRERESASPSLNHNPSSPQMRRPMHPSVKQLATPPTSDRSRSNSPLTRRPMVTAGNTNLDKTDRSNTGKIDRGVQGSANRRSPRVKKKSSSTDKKQTLSDDFYYSSSGNESVDNYVKELYASNAKASASRQSNLMQSGNNSNNTLVVTTTAKNALRTTSSSGGEKRHVFMNLEECCLNDVPSTLLDTDLKERAMQVDSSHQSTDFTEREACTPPTVEKENHERAAEEVAEIVIPLDKENKLVRLKSIIIDKFYSGDKRYFQSTKIAAHVESFVEDTMEDVAEILNERRCSRKKEKGGNGASIKAKKRPSLPSLEEGKENQETEEEDKYLVDTVRVSDTRTMYGNHCQALIRVTATLQDIPSELMVVLRGKARRSLSDAGVVVTI